MNLELEKFFEIDENAFYIDKNGERKFRGVNRYYGDSIRNDKADEQAKIQPVPYSMVFAYVNEFIERLRLDNGASGKLIKCEWIELDGIQQIVWDNGIIARGCDWELPKWDNTRKKYICYDKKYDVIKEQFRLITPRDIVWLKFTTKGHLGVVAKSFDINYGYNCSSGKLIKQVDEEWDKSFVLIFPLKPEILNKYTSGDIELAIGNYLISKGVPIIDYYSHNN